MAKYTVIVKPASFHLLETTMNPLKSQLLIVVLGFSTLAHAGGESVKITSPSDGSKVETSGTRVAYEAAGQAGDHVVVTVDGTQAAVLSELKGHYTLSKLSLGDHTVCIKGVDKGQVPTGNESCIRVTAANPGLATY